MILQTLYSLLYATGITMLYLRQTEVHRQETRMQVIKDAQTQYGIPFTFDQVFVQALRLPPLQKIRLVERLMSVLETELAAVAPESSSPKRSLFGVLAPFGPAPSTEEIDAARQEAWATFPRQDL